MCRTRTLAAPEAAATVVCLANVRCAVGSWRAGPGILRLKHLYGAPCVLRDDQQHRLCDPALPAHGRDPRVLAQRHEILSRDGSARLGQLSRGFGIADVEASRSWPFVAGRSIGCWLRFHPARVPRAATRCRGMSPAADRHGRGGSQPTKGSAQLAAPDALLPRPVGKHHRNLRGHIEALINIPVETSVISRAAGL